MANGTNFIASQGLPKFAKERLFRTKATRLLFNKGVKAKAFLTYSPPFSGKTSSLQLLMLYATIIHNRKVFMVPCAAFSSKSQDKDELFDQFLCYAANMNQSVIQLITGKLTRTDEEDRKAVGSILLGNDWIIMLDDVHRAYCVTKLWDGLKATKNVVFGFASYDSQRTFGHSCTPLDFKERMILDDQLFSRDEFDELATKFQKETQVNVSEFIRDRVYDLTSGYPGLACHSLSLLTVSFPKDGVGSSDIEIINKFNSNVVYQTITNYKDNRCFKKIDEIIEQVDWLLTSQGFQGNLKDLAKRVVLYCLYSLVVLKRGTVDKLKEEMATIKPEENLNDDILK